MVSFFRSFFHILFPSQPFLSLLFSFLLFVKSFPNQTSPTLFSTKQNTLELFSPYRYCFFRFWKQIFRFWDIETLPCQNDRTTFPWYLNAFSFYCVGEEQTSFYFLYFKRNCLEAKKETTFTGIQRRIGKEGKDSQIIFTFLFL